MVSLHTETARFKRVGHKNELCFFQGHPYVGVPPIGAGDVEGIE